MRNFIWGLLLEVYEGRMNALKAIVTGGAGFIGSQKFSFFAYAKNLGKTKVSVLRALGVRAVK